MARYVTSSIQRPGRRIFGYYRHIELFNKLALDVVANRIRNLIIMIPPQHGKTSFWAEWFPAWYLGNFPNDYIILVSYSTFRARQAGRRALNAFTRAGRQLFNLSVDPARHGAENWGVHNNVGGMISAGYGGSVSGNPATIAIVDDPIKDDKEAFSQAHKDGQWEWYQSVLSSRVHDNGHKIVISTRWAQDDLIGRIIEEHKNPGLEPWTVVRLPAIAEEDEDFHGWKRKAGEVLWPEERSEKLIHNTRRTVSAFWWATQWQQRPFPRAGQMFNPAKIRKVAEPTFDAVTSVRGWDLAATTAVHSKRTAGVLLERGVHPRKFRIADVKLGKWATNERSDQMKSTMELDGESVYHRIEQEPGSSGIDQAEHIVREMDGHWVEFERVTGKKELRADAVADAINRGEFEMAAGEWNREFIAELESYPNGRYKDQVDAMAIAFNWLIQQGVPSEGEEGVVRRECECGREPHETWCDNRFDEGMADSDDDIGNQRASDFNREFE